MLVTELFRRATIVQPVARKIDPSNYTAIAKYEELAKKVGICAPNYKRQQIFEDWLREKDLPVFALPEVVKYLTQKAKLQSARLGWTWRPIRRLDQIDHWFGNDNTDSHGRRSDHYQSNYGLYGRQIPYHALERIHVIETECNPRLIDGGCRPVAFFVNDYQVARPDPFLLAVLPKGGDNDPPRYVIDFWDEPGFGLEQMLA